MNSTGPASPPSRSPQSRALGQMPLVPVGIATSSGGSGSARIAGRRPSGVSVKQVKEKGGVRWRATPAYRRLT